MLAAALGAPMAEVESARRLSHLSQLSLQPSPQPHGPQRAARLPARPRPASPPRAATSAARHSPSPTRREAREAAAHGGRQPTPARHQPFAPSPPPTATDEWASAPSAAALDASAASPRAALASPSAAPLRSAEPAPALRASPAAPHAEASSAAAESARRSCGSSSSSSASCGGLSAAPTASLAEQRREGRVPGARAQQPAHAQSGGGGGGWGWQPQPRAHDAHAAFAEPPTTVRLAQVFALEPERAASERDSAERDAGSHARRAGARPPHDARAPDSALSAASAATSIRPVLQRSSAEASSRALNLRLENEAFVRETREQLAESLARAADD